MRGEGRHVLRVVAPCEQAAVDVRMQRLDASVEHLRKTRHLRDLGDSKSRVGQRLAVPPVESSPNPNCARERANSTAPDLSERLISAVRWMGIAGRLPRHCKP